VIDTLRGNLDQVRRRMENTAVKVGRDPAGIKLVAVSKTHPAEMLEQAISCGITIFGENKVQEAEPKILSIGRQRAEWHLIGHLQSNKARRAVELFDVIHTLDSIELAKRLERICSETGRDSLKVLAQIDLAGETTKSGVPEDHLAGLVEFLRGCQHLKFDGLMLVPPYFEDPEAVRNYFARLREIRDELVAGEAFAGRRGELSMGMSHDFEMAIEEGSTIVRVGTAIFGERVSAQF
jgi:pyridoxal phosphate enzyme (YggS family)